MGLRVKIKLIASIAFVLLTILHAQPAAAIEKLIRTLGPKGSMINVTQSQMVKEKSAGHIMGRGASISAPPLEDAHLLRANAPSCNWGGDICGQSMNIYTGGLSVISAQEFANFLKSLTQHAKAYASILAVKTVCPQCENIMTWLQEQAAFFNGLTIEGCETMKLLAGGMQTAADSAGKYMRQKGLLDSGQKKDMAALQQEAAKDSDNSEAGLPEGGENILGDNWNLVWKALSTRASKASSKTDVQFKEFMMSLTGSVISKKKGGRFDPEYLPSLIDGDSLKEYMGIEKKSKAMQVYKCDKTVECLNPFPIVPAFDESLTIKSKIYKLVASMMKKILFDGKRDFTDDEIVLDQMSSIDLLAIMEQNLAEYGYTKKNDQNNNSKFNFYLNESILNAICYDVVVEYLSKLINEARRAVAEMEELQVADRGKVFEKFENRCRELIEMLMNEKINATRIANNSLDLNEKQEHSKIRQLRRAYKGLKK